MFEQLCIVGHRQSLSGRGRAIMLVNGRHADANLVNLLAREARGIVTLAVTRDQANRLGLAAMHGAPILGKQPQFLASIEAACCTGTGISAADRALTAKVASSPSATPADLVSPGHIMPWLVPSPWRAGASLPERVLSVMLADGADDEAMLWSDILDEAGEVASFAEARVLANRLKLAFVEINALGAMADPALLDWDIAI